MHGTRWPPSHVVPLDARSGPLLPPAVTDQRPVVAGEHHGGVVIQTEVAQLSQEYVGRPVDAPHCRAVATVA